MFPWWFNLEREKDMTVSLKKRDKYEEVYRKRLATNKAAFDLMTEEQQKVVILAMKHRKEIFELF